MIVVDTMDTFRAQANLALNMSLVVKSFPPVLTKLIVNLFLQVSTKPIIHHASSWKKQMDPFRGVVCITRALQTRPQSGILLSLLTLLLLLHSLENPGNLYHGSTEGMSLLNLLHTVVAAPELFLPQLLSLSGSFLI